MSEQSGREGSAPRADAGAAEREARREEREARRAERQARRIRFGPAVAFDFDARQFARRVVADFAGEPEGESFTETIDQRFAFDAMPRLTVRNVSGETSINVGEGNEIHVVARKRVTAGSEERAKRQLQNLEVRIERHGEELRVEPHLYEQERGWLDLFRGKRFRVDFEILVPRECAVDAQTVSGSLVVDGVRGPLDVQTVSGEVRLHDVQGPLRVKSVSGDIDCSSYSGQVEGNTVSGDVTLDGVRLRGTQLNTVSGDIAIGGRLEPVHEHRLKSISGDVELALAAGDATVDYRTASGDLDCDAPEARVVGRGKNQYGVVVGDGHARVSVSTVSGDLTVRGSSVDTPAPGAAETGTGAATAADADGDRAIPMRGPEREEIRSVLDRVARGEIGVDDGAAALDAVRRGR